MKIKLIILFAVFVLLLSCNKTKDGPQFEGQYVTALTGNLTPVIMYTMQGEVKNASIIKDFFVRQRIGKVFEFDSSVISVTPKLMTLTILNDNKATVSSAIDEAPRNFEILNKSASQFVLADPVTTVDWNRRPGRCDSLYQNINTIPSEGVFLHSNIGGYGDTRYIFNEKFPVEIKNGQLFLPIMTSVITATNGPGYCITYNKGVYNFFNENIIGNLRVGDTILYQINKVQLIKQ